MPIRPENIDRYPPDWPAISQSIRQRAGNRCEECGLANQALGGRDDTGRFWPAMPTGADGLRTTWPQPGEDGWCERAPPLEPIRLRIIRIVLTVAHLDHTPENCDPNNLRAWCQRCHLRYDAAHHRKTAETTRRAQRAVGDLFQAST